MSAQAQDLVEAALAASTSDGCIVIAAEHTETNLRWAGNSLTTNGQMRTRNVTVVSIRDDAEGARAGVLTRSISNADELDELVRASEQAARDAAPADDAAPLVDSYPNDDDWAGDPAETSVAVFEQFATSLGEVFERWRKSDRLLFGFAEHQLTSSYLGTSTGVRRRFDQPDGRVEINGKSDDYARSAYVSQHSNDFADVDPQALAGSLDQRLDWAASKIDLPAGRYETLLPPTCVADLNIYAYLTASARDAEEGRSVFAGADGVTRIGERLSPLPLRLYSDPNYPGLECAPFQINEETFGSLWSVFDNGLPRPAVDWMRDGALTNLVRTRAWGAKTDAKPCPIIDNLIMDGNGSASLEEMIAATERGLLLTTLWYIREVDPQTLLLTGLTRDGVYLVENGAVRGAVNNFRFNESPIDLWSRVTEVGRTEPAMSREWNDFFRRSAMPAVRVPDFNMSTVSKAS
ncbi:MAG TPA: metallopeptidase TldD-related protein [Jatrophihabitantaceae bacterium]|jgi:predicted Zn-dependent protease|nr:metallopeptidase TldD-related protein [Jatrophihabitantaceae bacterium]